MSDAWTTYPGAPDPGARICHVDDLPDAGALPFEIGTFPILVVCAGGELRAFVNACPHQFLPLTYRGNAVLSADETTLRCTNHDAAFDAQTGQGLSGFGQGCELDPVPVRVSASGEIFINS